MIQQLSILNIDAQVFDMTDFVKSNGAMCQGVSISGLYYKHIMIVIDIASVISKWRSKL